MSCDAFGDCGSQKITVIGHADSGDVPASNANVIYEYAPGGSMQVGALLGEKHFYLGDGSLGEVRVEPGEEVQIRSLNAISGDVAFLGIRMPGIPGLDVLQEGHLGERACLAEGLFKSRLIVNCPPAFRIGLLRWSRFGRRGHEGREGRRAAERQARRDG